VTNRAYGTPPQPDHEHVGRISTGTILFIIAATAIAVYALQVILLPFVISGIVSYICEPAIGFFSLKLRLPRLLIAIAAFSLLLGLGASIGFLGVPSLVKELTHLVTDFQDVVDRLVKSTVGEGTITLMGQQMTASELANAITAVVRSWVSNARLLSIVAGSMLMTTFGVFLTIMLLFFFLVSGPMITRGLLWLVPPGQRGLIEDHILTNLDPVLRRYFIGVIAVVCFAAAFAYVGLGLVLGVPHALFLALITGVLEAIPIIGPITAAVIAGLVALQHNAQISAIVGYSIYLAALRLSIDQLFGPVVLGAAGRVHPALIIFCFLAGGTLLGVVGVIMAVPVALTIKATLSVLYDEQLNRPVDANQ
jgi:predicted PurR-regulated permease PerM